MCVEAESCVSCALTLFKSMYFQMCLPVIHQRLPLCVCAGVPACACVCVHEVHRQNAIIEGPPADFTQSAWPHWR